MKLSVVYRPSVPASASPYRLLDQGGQEIVWANAFLDAQCIRQLSPRSLRAYAYDLLKFVRWWEQDPPRPLAEITESTMLDYARHQLDQEPKPRRDRKSSLGRSCVACIVSTLDARYPVARSIFNVPNHTVCPRLWAAAPCRGFGPAPQGAATRHRAAHCRRGGQVLGQFRTFRDLAMVGLMLLEGLRSCEVLALQLGDLQMADAQI